MTKEYREKRKRPRKIVPGVYRASIPLIKTYGMRAWLYLGGGAHFTIALPSQHPGSVSTTAIRDIQDRKPNGRP